MWIWGPGNYTRSDLTTVIQRGLHYVNQWLKCSIKRLQYEWKIQLLKCSIRPLHMIEKFSSGMMNSKQTNKKCSIIKKQMHSNIFFFRKPQLIKMFYEFFTYFETSLLPVKGCKFRPMIGHCGSGAVTSHFDDLLGLSRLRFENLTSQFSEVIIFFVAEN